jgi:hypothetical protein
MGDAMNAGKHAIGDAAGAGKQVIGSVGRMVGK